MEKQKITVVCDCIKWQDGKTIKCEYFDVEAYCVGGKDGVFAIYEDPNNKDIFVLASGDDGFWKYNMSFAKHWFDGIILALSLSINKTENQVLLDQVQNAVKRSNHWADIAYNLQHPPKNRREKRERQNQKKKNIKEGILP